MDLQRERMAQDPGAGESARKSADGSPACGSTDRALRQCLVVDFPPGRALRAQGTAGERVRRSTRWISIRTLSDRLPGTRSNEPSSPAVGPCQSRL